MSSRIVLPRRGVGAVLSVSLLAACAGEERPSDRPSPSPARPEINAAQLRSASYASQYVQEGTVRLTDGFFEDTARRLIVLLQPEYAVGDLDGDGSPDAAVVLSTNTGGTGTFQDLVAVLNTDEVAHGEPTMFLGDRVPVDRVRIEDGEIRLEMTMHGPADPMCCPTLRVTRRFRLAGGELTEIEPPPGAPDYTP